MKSYWYKFRSDLGFFFTIDWWKWGTKFRSVRTLLVSNAYRLLAEVNLGELIVFLYKLSTYIGKLTYGFFYILSHFCYEPIEIELFFWFHIMATFNCDFFVILRNIYIVIGTWFPFLFICLIFYIEYTWIKIICILQMKIKPERSWLFLGHWSNEILFLNV